jgi:hypothetical protein
MGSSPYLPIVESMEMLAYMPMIVPIFDIPSLYMSVVELLEAPVYMQVLLSLQTSLEICMY